MEVWITKYVLTKGILECNAEIIDRNMIRVSRGLNSFNYYHKPYWYENLDDAVKHAVILIEKNIKVLNKKLQKMENMLRILKG